MSEPKEGKLFVAANPWPLAAIAKRRGLPTDRFRETDFVPDGVVYVIDLDALNVLPPDPFARAGAPVPPGADE